MRSLLERERGCTMHKMLDQAENCGLSLGSVMLLRALFQVDPSFDNNCSCINLGFQPVWTVL